MEWGDLPSGAIVVLLATCAGGGLWFVVRQMWNFSAKVTDKVVADNMRLRGIIQAKDDNIELLRAKLLECEGERGAMEATLWQNGIRWRSPRNGGPGPRALGGGERE